MLFYKPEVEQGRYFELFQRIVKDGYSNNISNRNICLLGNQLQLCKSLLS